MHASPRPHDPLAPSHPRHDALSRRTFMQLSIAGSTTLALAGMAASLGGCSRETAKAAGFKVIRDQDLPLLTRLLPAALADALPKDADARKAATARAVASFDQLLYDTSPAVRTIFLQVLDLLTLGITRGPLFGQWRTWENANEADASALLDRLANSSIGFLRGIYNGLSTMAMMAWYLEPENQPAAIYPGPPRKIAS